MVCGASRGLGRAIVLELARRGVTKIAICARSRDELDKVAGELVHRGVSVVAEPCDLSSQDEVDRFVGNATARLGPVDVLVTNAATISVAPFAVLDRGDFDRAMQTTFYSALSPIFAVSRTMRERRTGVIAIVTSIGARVGVPHLAPYCAAKFATMGLAESLRAELASDGVRVLTVVPGLMRTGAHVHAEVKGDHEREYAWFAASAMAPIVSIDADRAARRIVSAIEKRKVEISFTPEARLAPLLRTLFPTLFAGAMALVAKLLLPKAPDAAIDSARRAYMRDGKDIEKTSRSSLVRALRAHGRPLVLRHAQ